MTTKAEGENAASPGKHKRQVSTESEQYAPVTITEGNSKVVRSQSMPVVSSEEEDSGSLTRWQKACAIVVFAAAITGILAVNLGIYLLAGLILGAFLAKIAFFLMYYCLSKYLVSGFAFPGSKFYPRRAHEFGYCQSFAHQMLTSLNSFKSKISNFAMTMKFNEKRTHSYGQKTLICDQQKTFEFIQECYLLKKMIKQFAD